MVSTVCGGSGVCDETDESENEDEEVGDRNGCRDG